MKSTLLTLARRKKIIELRTLGFTLQQIADTLDLAYSTVWKDVQVAGKERAKQLENEIDAYIHRYEEGKLKRIRELWAMYARAENDKERRKILKQIDDMEERLIETLQRLDKLPALKGEKISILNKVEVAPLDNELATFIQRFEQRAKSETVM